MFLRVLIAQPRINANPRESESGRTVDHICRRDVREGQGARSVQKEDRVYWHSKTTAERLAAAEQLRQIAYGHDPATARIQRVVVRTFLNGG